MGRRLVKVDGEERIVRVQQMFPNCQKYKKCCVDDAEFWKKYEAKVKSLLDYKAPEGFEGW